MASPSSSRQRDEENDSLTGIEPPSKRPRSSEPSDTYDVFIIRSGEDVKEILTNPLHLSLCQAQIPAYVDEEENRLGDSIPSNIKNAIFSASVHVAIFSPNCAESPGWLAELTLMLQTGAPIIPVFYGVDSADVRHLRSSYAVAFSKYKATNPDKLEEWKNSLGAVSDHLGHCVDISQDNPDMNEACQILVSRVKELLVKRNVPLELEKEEVEKRKIPLEVAGYKVGLDGLVEDFEKHLQQMHQDRGKMVGIVGIGGSGKTTLARELFNRKCSDYDRSSFLFDVREVSANGKLTSLQGKLLRDLFHSCNQKINSTEEGIILLKYNLKKLSRFLIVIDDIDNQEQLNALVPLYTLNANSLVIVTAREERVLEQADISVPYRIKAMGLEHGRQLFSWHAFHEEPTSGYEDLVKCFVEKCNGVPLSLRVLGGHVLGRDKDTWQQELGKVPETLEVNPKLELSYEALEDEQKDIFVDIACFFIEKNVEMAMRIWKGLEWQAAPAVKTLTDKCLVDVVQQDFDEEPPHSVFRMHEDLRKLGRKMAASRPIERRWRRSHLKPLESTPFQNILTENQNQSFRCLNSIKDMSVTYFLGNLATSTALQWLELSSKCIPSGIPLQDLEGLRIVAGVPKTLWERNDQAPRKLKELLCKFTKLDRIQRAVLRTNWSEYSMSLGDLSGLECLILKLESEEDRRAIEIEWNSFLETVRGLTYLKTLDLLGLHINGEIGLSTSMSRLESLTLSKVALTPKVSISGEYCPTLKCLKIEKMKSLTELNLKGVTSLERLELSNCRDLEKVLANDMQKLERLSIESCPEVKELPNFGSLSFLKRIRIMLCEELQVIEGIENLSCVEDITITCCPKLQISRGIENFKRMKSMILSDGSMWRCVSMIQELPSEFTVVMGAAKPSLNADQFSEIISREGEFNEFKSKKEGYQKLQSLQRSGQSFTAIILCAMIVSKAPTYMDRRPQFGGTIRLSWESEEKLIHTIVVTDPNEISMLSHSIPSYCWMPTFHLENKNFQPQGGIEKGYILGVNEGCKTLLILKRLTEQLYTNSVVTDSVSVSNYSEVASWQ